MNQPPANSKHPTPSAPRPNQAGVGLIEVLVAVLVLSIGVLGMAALQTRALSNSGSSTSQSMATIASYSILEAMRVDRVNALQNVMYNKTVTADNCPAVGTTLAQLQINSWCTQLGKSLGAVASTTGKIVCSSTGTCTVTVTFDDSKAGANTSNQVVTQTIITQAGL